jgi:hypothetical protein
LLPHFACRVFGTPLLIARAKLDVILSVLLPRMSVSPDLHLTSRDSSTQATTTMESSRITTAASTIDLTAMDAAHTGISVIPIYGSLVKRTVGLQVESGLTSYAAIADQIDSAVADPGVSGIVLDIDSPGGEAAGVFELARRIRAGEQLQHRISQVIADAVGQHRRPSCPNHHGLWTIALDDEATNHHVVAGKHLTSG